VVTAGQASEVLPVATHVAVVGIPVQQATTVLTLPAAPSEGSTVTIKDEAATAGTTTIIVSSPGTTVEGGETLTISANYGSVTLLFVGGRWVVQSRLF
jgi:hypothetical protein